MHGAVTMTQGEIPAIDWQGAPIIEAACRACAKPECTHG